MEGRVRGTICRWLLITEKRRTSTENLREHFQPIANPLFAMRIISASFFIPPAQISPPHTAMHQMKHLYLVVRKDLNPIHSWHRRRSRQKQKIPADVAVHRIPVTSSLFEQVHGTCVCACKVVVRSANKTDAGVQHFFTGAGTRTKAFLPTSALTW